MTPRRLWKTDPPAPPPPARILRTGIELTHDPLTGSVNVTEYTSPDEGSADHNDLEDDADRQCRLWSNAQTALPEEDVYHDLPHAREGLDDDDDAGNGGGG